MKALDLIEATGQIDDRIILEVTSTMKKSVNHTSKSYKKRIVTFALAAALILSLGVVAYATGFFGLINLSADSKDGPIIIVDAGNSLVAAEEWKIYLEDNKDTNVLAPNTPIDIYCDYGAFTQEAKDKLDSIVQQHGLKLFTERSQCDNIEQLYTLLHTDAFLPAGSGNGHGAVFDSKSVYSFVTDAVIQNGKTIYYDFYLLSDGYFMNPATMLTDASDYEETGYSVSGAEITLAIGKDRSYILADTDSYSLAVYIRAGSENENETLSSINYDTVTIDDLKLFVDSVDFAEISNIYN